MLTWWLLCLWGAILIFFAVTLVVTLAKLRYLLRLVIMKVAVRKEEKR